MAPLFTGPSAFTEPSKKVGIELVCGSSLVMLTKKLNAPLPLVVL
jgi:hypothetical protein